MTPANRRMESNPDGWRRCDSRIPGCQVEGGLTMRQEETERASVRRHGFAQMRVTHYRLPRHHAVRRPATVSPSTPMCVSEVHAVSASAPRLRAAAFDISPLHFRWTIGDVVWRMAAEGSDLAVGRGIGTSGAARPLACRTAASAAGLTQRPNRDGSTAMRSAIARDLQLARMLSLPRTTAPPP